MELDKVVDQTMPKGKWEFDESVTAAFGDMLERSIPDYHVMRKLCLEIGKKYVRQNTAVVDLGCSRGDAMADLVYMFGANNMFIGCEVSRPMIDAARQRFSGYENCGVVRISELDLRDNYPAAQASLTLAILTIQFTPIEHRQMILRNVYKHTLPGGAFVFVEKILGADADLDKTFVDLYYDVKRANGYTQDAIDRKRLSLEGVLVPATAKWNEDMLRSAGFRSVDCFWRNLNFAGWIAVKTAD